MNESIDAMASTRQQFSFFLFLPLSFILGWISSASLLFFSCCSGHRGSIPPLSPPSILNVLQKKKKKKIEIQIDFNQRRRRRRTLQV